MKEGNIDFNKTIQENINNYETKRKEAYIVLEELYNLRTNLVSELKNNDEHQKLLKQFDNSFIRLFPGPFDINNLKHPNESMKEGLREIQNRYQAPDFNANIEEKITFLNKNIKDNREKNS